MSGFFVAANSQRIVNTAPPALTYPFTVGVWVRLANSVPAIEAVWSFTDATTTGTYFFLWANSPSWAFRASLAGANSDASVGFALDGWSFVLCRGISATNRRISVLTGLGTTTPGSITHGQDTFSRTPTGINTASIGSLEISTPARFFDGYIAEFWFTDTDIQPGGGQTDNALLRKLAYGGPFSTPHVAGHVVEYRAMRSSLGSNTDRQSDAYSFRNGRKTWTNTNGVTIGRHPPLSSYYARPQGMGNLPLSNSFGAWASTASAVNAGPMVSLIF